LDGASRGETSPDIANAAAAAADHEVVQHQDRLYENISIKENFEDFNARKMKKRSKCQKLLEKFLMSNITTVFISIITIIVLYADDFRIIAVVRDEDMYIDILLICSIIVFVMELIISTYALPGYPWSFFFWLDVISILSMPMDIYVVMEYFSGQSDDLIFQTDDASNVARVGRASRVGTKAGRYIKLVKLIKIIKVSKFFSQA
jgi:hypothetical protein